MRVCGSRSCQDLRGYRIERRYSRAPVGFRDVIEDETANLPFDVARLVADRNLNEAAKENVSSCQGRVRGAPHTPL